MDVCLHEYCACIGGEINFLYNNRYYYKLYLLTEKQIDIQEYFMHAKSGDRDIRTGSGGRGRKH